VEEVVVDPPKAYELRIKIVCTSLCHSDVTFWRMKVRIAAGPSVVARPHLIPIAV
jgi:S-(hydroxymethyl)glutathione dehydrogenase/alcohol dehydrogenase